MKFSVLSSGSKANSTCIEVDGIRLLIDCGLSCRKLELRLLSIGIDPSTISAVLVTHEHEDHTRGISTFSRKHRIPVYANRETGRFIDRPYAIKHFNTGSAFSIMGLQISPFSIPHDASDPVGFSIFGEGLKFCQVTDLGRVTPLVRDALTLCDALVIESNHDEQLLWSCGYPWALKQRIASSHGHLSNAAAAELLSEICHPGLQYVVLGHLSENSNNPDFALGAARSVLGRYRDLHLLNASVHAPTPLFEVERTDLFSVAV